MSYSSTHHAAAVKRKTRVMNQDNQQPSGTNPATWERTCSRSSRLKPLPSSACRADGGPALALPGCCCCFLLLFAMLGWFGGKREGSSLEKHTALVELKGVISSESRASADKVISALQHAFKDKNTQGVVLRINSPGGSPVQAGYINDEIKRLRNKHKEIPLYVVVQDICASGGYYVAAAADKIFVDKASHHRLDRRVDGWLWIYRHDGKAWG